MYLMDYDSVKLTNYVQRFRIIPRDLLHDLRNGWYLGRGMQEPAYYEAVRDLTAYVDGLADAGLNVARIDR